MSRNKVILLLGALVLLYLALPNEGIYLTVKTYMLAVAPYAMLTVILYLLISINLLKKALYRLSAEVSEENVLSVTRFLKITFDVKRMIGTVNLIDIYKRVNGTKKISYETKNQLYEVLKRKRIEIPLPTGTAAKARG